MRQSVSYKVIFLALLIGLLASLWPAAEVHARQAENQQPGAGQSQKQQQRALTAGQAAAKAKAQYGGKVLKVTPSGKGYRVKLLTESGTVRTVTIQD